MLSNKTIVNSWNEWDALKRIIIGHADDCMVQAPELAAQRHWSENGYPKGKLGPYPKDMIDMANQQLDNFSKMLESRGIIVDRPTPLDFSQQVSTPDWVQGSMVGCMPPRDLLLPVGNEIVEAPMSFRSRWIEYLSYRPILEKYFTEDPNFRYEAAPKPRLTEQTYKEGFLINWKTLSDDEKKRHMRESYWILTEVEPCFDAVDVVRCSKDLFV